MRILLHILVVTAVATGLADAFAPPSRLATKRGKAFTYAEAQSSSSRSASSSSLSSSSPLSREPQSDRLVNNDNENVIIPSPKFLASAVPGPPLETKPDYENIVGPLGRWMDRIFMITFRRKLAQQVGRDSSKPIDDYSGIVDLAATLNREIPNRNEIHRRAQTVLRNLFPSWMPVRARTHT